MKVLISLLFFACFAITLPAQPAAGIITGTIKTANNEVIPAATVRLLNALDSTPVKTGTTGENGKFQFSNIPQGTYFLSVTAVAQKQFTSMSFRIDSVHYSITLPAVILLPAKTTTMAEVIVKAKRPLIEQEIDKTVVNVPSMISSATSNALEVLEKTPGVTVGSNGEISLNGRGSILVLIDGRSTYMSGADLAAYLKSLPGSLLDKIELMDNPPARYDASGNGIINIRLKKNRAGGYTGSVSTGYTQGRYGRHNDAVNLTYDHKKMNLFASIGYNKEKNYTDDDYTRQFYNTGNEIISTVSLLNRQQYTSNSINVNAGLDYAVSANTSYGFQVNVNKSNRNGALNYTSRNYNAFKQLDTIGTGGNSGGDKKTNLGTNVNFLHKFGKTGRELSADVNYLNYYTDGIQTVQNFLSLPDSAQVNNNRFQYVLPTEVSIYTIKADYVHPLKNKARLETGFKSSIVNNNSIADYYTLTGDAKKIDYGKSNHFKYHENINAIYVNAQKNWKRIGTQLGLRVENTKATGHQPGNDSVQSGRQAKDYTQLFPSLFISYKLDTSGKNSLTASITRRINRPNYQLLNPFIFFRDQYSYTAGNPLLNPQYQYRYELRYQHSQFLRMGLSYNRFTNVILQTTEAKGNIFITRSENIATGYMVLLNTSLSLSPAKWWNLSSDILLSNIGLNGMTYTEKLNPSTYIARINVLNQLRFNKGWSAELGGYYASRDISAQAYSSGMYRMNIGVQKKIWKDKGSLRFGIDDMFHSWVYHNSSISLKQAQFYQVTGSDTQRIGIAFTWRFGRDDASKKRRHDDHASDEEKGRVM